MFCSRSISHYKAKNLLFQSCRLLSVGYPAKVQFSQPYYVKESRHSVKKNQAIKKRNDQMNKIQLRKARKKQLLVQVPQNVRVSELAELTQSSTDVIMDAIFFVDPKANFHNNSILKDFSFVNAVVNKLGLRCKLQSLPKLVESKDMDVYRSSPITDKSKLTRRPPVVTIMGHIDHGKTTLLDALRNTSVAAGEAGGITQAIGAFSVKVQSGETITFLDTPGHAAFSSMRKRGAQLTDIVVLVVAADDGVMEQTVESIKATQLANVPMIVAINKCDKKNADASKVLKELIHHEVVADALGGDVQTVEISALKQTGLDKLVECITFLSDVLEVSANNSGKVEGVVLESLKQHGIGSVTSTVIQQGTLCKGQWLVAGTSTVRVKGIFDENRKPLAKALPGFPINIFGWSINPRAGDVMLQVENKAQADQVVKWRKAAQDAEKALLDNEAIQTRRMEERRQYRNIRLNVPHKIHRIYKLQKAMNLSYVKETEIPELGVVIKADTDGSLDVLLNIFDSYDCEKRCLLTIVDFGVGEITESDLDRAELAQGTIVAFNTQPSAAIKAAAESRRIPVISNDVIYHLVDNLKDAMSTLVLPEKKYTVLGEASVVELFDYKEKKVTNSVAGCKVNEGELLKDETFLLLRDDEILYEGPLLSLRQNKEIVSSVVKRKECGLILGGDASPQPGDVIQCCSVESVKNKISWTPPGF